jgi:hypothetical protein
MVDSIPEDMVYTITTGFYPELFSSDGRKKPLWKAKRGTGRKGMQWVSTRGFSKASVQKIGGKHLEGKDKYEAFFVEMLKGKSWKESFGALDAKTQKGVMTRGRELFSEEQDRNALVNETGKGRRSSRFSEDGNFSQSKMEANLNFYKFMGGNERYKLWGSKVWWQHGERNDEKIETGITEWAKKDGADNKDMGTYLESLYVKKEPEFWKMARKLAEDVFETALDEDNLRTELESVGKEAHVPEEERIEASREAKGKGLEVDSIDEEWRKISKARGLDIKYRMDENTTIFMDATEMPLNQQGSHGIVLAVQKKLRAAIKEAKGNSENWKSIMKTAVIKMFEASIDLYNTDIKAIVDAGTETGKKPKGMDTIKKLFSEVTEGRGGNPASVRAIAARTNLKIAANVKLSGKAALADKAKAAAQETTLSYVIHMIVNLAGDANDNYRQGHLIGRMHGAKTYASVGMRLKNKKSMPEFSKAYMRRNTFILQGESHLIAYQTHKKDLESGKAQETHARQIQAFQNGKIFGAGRTNKTGFHRAGAVMGQCGEVRPATRVSFHPKAMGKMLEQIPDVIGKNVATEKIKEKAAKSMRKMGPAKIKEHRNGAKFWALPYIGLMEYPNKQSSDTEQ